MIRKPRPLHKITQLAIIMLLSVSIPSLALTRIRDIARPWGERMNHLHGLGLVVGLNGTGDGGDALITLRPLREMLTKLGNPVSLEELNSKNIALVQVTAEIGRTGGREGDSIDVRIASIGNAKDLTGGVLWMSFLQSANPDDERVYVIAQGPVTVTDGTNKVVGIVKNGGYLEANIFHDYVDYGDNGEASFTLVIDESHATWQTAKTIAMTIDQELSAPGAEYQDYAEGLDNRPMAIARDAKNVLVRIPRSRVSKNQAFIADIMNIQLDLPEPSAVVVVNRKAATIAITGNVEIAPVSVCVDGLMIRISEPAPEQPATANNPRVRQSEWAKFDTEGAATTKLDTLIEALDQLNVPVQQKINAIYAIEQAGTLRGTVRTE